MSLRRKFAILLGLLALTVVVSLGAAGWSFNLLQREVAAPFADLAGTLGTLSALKSELATSPDSSPDPEALQVLLDDLRRSSATLGLVGVSTSRNLSGRIDAVIDDRRSGGSVPPETRRAAVRLIERVESQVASNAGLTLEHVSSLRRNLTIAMTLSLIGAVLVATLGFLLMDRWIVRPVGALREAAQRIGSGDFDHRVPVNGNDEIARLSGEVNRMASMVARLQEERIQRERLAAAGQMLRRLVHNLRNPLSGIRSLAELSADDAPRGSELRENQSRIVATIDRFETWLSDLLHRTSPVNLSIETVHVPEWLEAIAETHRAAASARDVTLITVPETAPDGAGFDPGHLEQAVSVVLANAIEASPRGATVRLQAERDAGGGGWWIQVTDEGGGVADDLRDRIFEPHFTTKPGGIGIGLAFALEVVRAHGGRIAISASESGGAAFRIDLPLGAADRADAPSGRMQPV